MYLKSGRKTVGKERFTQCHKKYSANPPLCRVFFYTECFPCDIRQKSVFAECPMTQRIFLKECLRRVPDDSTYIFALKVFMVSRREGARRLSGDEEMLDPLCRRVSAVSADLRVRLLLDCRAVRHPVPAGARHVPAAARRRGRRARLSRQNSWENAVRITGNSTST